MTDKAFLEWIETQRSCLTGNFSEYLNGDGRSIACHVRRAGRAGTSYKPPYSAVPMTFGEHAVQSHQGELEAIRKYNAGLARVITTLDEAKDWFDEQARKFRCAWYEYSGDEEVLQYGI
jgi:hypothetical protein